MIRSIAMLEVCAKVIEVRQLCCVNPQTYILLLIHKDISNILNRLTDIELRDRVNCFC